MKEIRKGHNNQVHYALECFWCKRDVIQRKDVYTPVDFKDFINEGRKPEEYFKFC